MTTDVTCTNCGRLRSSDAAFVSRAGAIYCGRLGCTYGAKLRVYLRGALHRLARRVDKLADLITDRDP